MQVPDGFRVQLVASEPEVRQPILVKYDDRGRLWVIQYLQYPNPAGLKRAKVDRWSRTVYDRIPEPPPKGPKGADRITILEDTDGDGRADKFKDFVDGLNLTTGLAFGHGGVYVLQVPYLLFYPDRNRDDVPDGDPEVLLTGFGMEDAQSFANHLTWGPDGWLYGVNGSTTTCNIRGIEFQQGVWRYHSISKAFELFCEGGGNLFGLSFDERGNLFYSSNGNYLFFHAVQGGYFAKNYGKHGPLHNRYAYGVLPELLKRTPMSGGPTTGGTIYLGESFPERFRGTFIGGDFLGHTVSWWNVKPRGSTFEATRGGVLLDCRDTWATPTDCCLAPDGSMVVCDFYDKRTAHPDPDAEWDRSNGRVYRIAADDAKPLKPFDLSKLSGRELIEMLKQRNGWFADRAREALAARQDKSLHEELRALALQEKDALLALKGLWALHVSGGFDERFAIDLLKHGDEHVRAWSIRLLGDGKEVNRVIAARFAEMAERDASATVRMQLAASAKRLPGSDALPIIEGLIRRGMDADDPYIPWLIWWAVEDKALSDIPALLRFFTAESWKNSLVAENGLRVVRRWAAERSRAGYEACARLILSVPADRKEDALKALDAGLSERGLGLQGVGMGDLFRSLSSAKSPGSIAAHFGKVEGPLRATIQAIWREKPNDVLCLRIACRAEINEADAHVLERLAAADAKQTERIAMLGILSQLGKSDCTKVVLKRFVDADADAERLAALDVLQRLVDSAHAVTLLDAYAKSSPAVRAKLRDVLISHRESARALLNRVEAKQIAANDIPVVQLRLISLYQDKELDALVRKHWGNIQPGTAEEKLAVMRRLSNDLRAGAGDPVRGKAIFDKSCGNCHRLFGEGGNIGPDLTSFSRGDREALLVNIVDPSAVIRTQYLSYIVTTTGGATHTGIMAEQDAASVTLLDAMNQRRRIPRDQIESIRESPVSLMPDDQWKEWGPQQLRDLFNYLQRDKPLAK